MKNLIRKILKEDKAQKLHNYTVKDILSRVILDSYTTVHGKPYIDICFKDMSGGVCEWTMSHDSIFSTKWKGYPNLPVKLFHLFKRIYGVTLDEADDIWMDVVDRIREMIFEEVERMSNESI
jgi:hypothetical protein